MTLIRRSDYRPMVNNFFDDFLLRDLFNWPSTSETGTTIPKVNIRETGDDFRVEMAAPGMTKNDFRVELDNGTLIISSELTKEDESKSGSYSMQEFSYQSFRRVFHLPEHVQGDKIDAKYENGILYLTIPKKDEVKKKAVRTIKIK